MNYQIDLIGIHCEGCTKLIKLSMEEADFKVSTVDLKNRNLKFRPNSEKSQTAIQEDLNTVFSDLPGYGFSNLTTID